MLIFLVHASGCWIASHGQVNVIPFYQKAGFEITSEQFLDANIPHKQITLSLLQKQDLQKQEERL